MQIQSKFIADLAIVTSKLGALAVTGAKIAADTIAGSKILLGNADPLRARNAANNANVNLLQLNASDQAEGLGQWLFPNFAPQSSVAPVGVDDLTNKAYVDAAVSAGVNSNKQAITLSGTDISNQYVDLAQLTKPNTLIFEVGGVVQIEGADYSLSTVLGVTRVTFLGDLATGGAAALVAGDIANFQYLY